MFRGVVGVVLTAGGQDRLEETPTAVGGPKWRWAIVRGAGKEYNGKTSSACELDE